LFFFDHGMPSRNISHGRRFKTITFNLERHENGQIFNDKPTRNGYYLIRSCYVWLASQRNWIYIQKQMNLK